MDIGAQMCSYVQYCGQYGVQTDENGLIYMRARYYSPEVCRFVSQDSVIGSISSSQSLNRFAYCGGNPINYVDPTGTDAASILSGSWGIAGTMMAVDGPLPYGDVIGLIAGVSGTTIAGGMVLYEGIKSVNDLIKALLPTGEPNSTQDVLNPDGTLKQRRWYGPDGRAQKDVDYNHGGVGHTFPHQHDWDWSSGTGERSKNPKPVDEISIFNIISNFSKVRSTEK